MTPDEENRIIFQDHIEQLRRELVGRRLQLGLNASEMSRILGFGRTAVGHMEAEPAWNPAFKTAMMYGRGLGWLLDVQLAGPLNPNVVPMAATLLRAAGDRADPNQDAFYLSGMMEIMISHRRWTGMQQVQVDLLMGNTAPMTYHIEAVTKDPRIMTWMRYAKAIGLELTCAWRPDEGWEPDWV